MEREEYIQLTDREQEVHIDGLLHIDGKRLDLNWSDSDSNEDLQAGIKQVNHLCNTEQVKATFIAWKGAGWLHIHSPYFQDTHYVIDSTYLQAGGKDSGFIDILRKIIDYKIN